MENILLIIGIVYYVTCTLTTFAWIWGFVLEDTTKKGDLLGIVILCILSPIVLPLLIGVTLGVIANIYTGRTINVALRELINSFWSTRRNKRLRETIDNAAETVKTN